MNDAIGECLRRLPPLNDVLGGPECTVWIDEFGRDAVLLAARQSLDECRREVSANPVERSRGEWVQDVLRRISTRLAARRLRRLRSAINATGVVLHTNLGRAPLADRAIEAIARAGRTGNVELDFVTGNRKYRGYQIEDLWQELTGAEDALVVNNCAAATLLALQATAAGREMIVSRGQLIEIGGSYRLPDVFRQSGAILREVGTTNRTRLQDYEKAIGPETAGVLRVHPSNFRVKGFTESVEIKPLVDLARKNSLIAIDDIGSGSLIDLAPYGLPDEPTVAASIAAGADLVLFSGDKLLGGPQCGVILGSKSAVAKLRESPLARALRIDKLTLAALQATLEIYARGQALKEIPVLRQLTIDQAELQQRADRLAALLPGGIKVEVRASISAVGGGSLPTTELPTWVVTIQSSTLSADELSKRLRIGTPAIISRIENNAVLFDVRTLFPSDETAVAEAVREVCSST